jgi:uncharacterized protein (TIGR02246 family)
MNRIALPLLAALALLLCASVHATEKSATLPTLGANDEKAVRALVDEFASAWNQHDMKALHDIDTDDVEWVNVVGHDWPGKTTVLRGHTAFHKTLARKSHVIVESANIRAIAPDVAVAVATMRFTPLVGTDGQELGPPAKTRGSFIVVKREGTWKVAHFQNTEIDPRYENDDLPNWPEAGPPLTTKESR